MMNLKEAIAHARDVAKNCGVEGRDCAYQHDKLADWLEELQAYRETGLAPEEMYAVRLLAASADHDKAKRLIELAEADAKSHSPQWRTGTPEREGWYWACDEKNECYDLYWRGNAWYLFPANVSSTINGLVGEVIVKWYPLPEPEATP